jgi:hypothetical protein
MAPASRLGAAPGLPRVPAAPAPTSWLGAASGPPRAPAALAPASWPGVALRPPRVTWSSALTIWLMAAPELPRVLRTGSTGRKQINKYPMARVDATSKGSKKGRLRLGRLEHNTTQFSHGRRVLRSGGLNHVNHRVHRVHLELTTKRLKVFSAKEPQWGALERLRWKCRKTTSTVDALGRKTIGF